MAENSNPQILKNGVAVGRSFKLNFIEGANVTLTVTASGENADVTIASSGGAGGGFAVDTGGNVA